MRNFLLSERLIVAADFKQNPGERNSVMHQVCKLADSVADLGIYLKVNSALRANGYLLIEMIKQRGLRVFADLKLNDIPETLATDGDLLHSFSPDLLTVMASTGQKAISALKSELPETEVLGVTVLTSLGDSDTAELFGDTTENAVLKFAAEAHLGGADGVIASPKEAAILRKIYINDATWPGMTINTPGIRPEWSLVKNDDQKRSATPADAIRAGADRIVIGRPITQAESPRAAVMRTLDEIQGALSSR